MNKMGLEKSDLAKTMCLHVASQCGEKKEEKKLMYICGFHRFGKKHLILYKLLKTIVGCHMCNAIPIIEYFTKSCTTVSGVSEEDKQISTNIFFEGGVLDELLYFCNMSDILAVGGSQALGGIYAKFNSLNNVGVFHMIWCHT